MRGRRGEIFFRPASAEPGGQPVASMPADADPSPGVDSAEATGCPVLLLKPEDLAKKYAVHKQTILAWFHEGLIPAEVAVGKVYRFDEVRVARALATMRKRAPREETAGRLSGMVQVI